MNECTTINKDVVDIRSVVNGQSFNRFTVLTVSLSFLILLLDGFDLMSIGFLVPVISKEWGIGPSSFGIVLSLSNVGLIFGALLFGYIGDKYGRKKAILSSVILFSILSFGCAVATSIKMLLVFRVLAALGMGGLQPIIFVLNSDMSPDHSKLKRVTLLFAGANLGSALGGIIAAKILPTLGWRAIFIIGGIAPLLLVIFIALWLPESLTWLASNKKNKAEIAAIVKKMRPDIDVTPVTEFVYTAEQKKEKAPLRQLFVGKLSIVTPLLWLVFCIATFSVAFILSWFPTIFVNMGMTVSTAAKTVSLAPLFGILGSTFVGLFLDKAGYKWSTIIPIGACICFASFSFIPLESSVGLIACLGIFAASNFAMLSALTPVFYPVNIRSNAAGVGMAISKIGSISAPLIGGFMIQAKVPYPRIFIYIALPLIISAVVMFILANLYNKYFCHTSTIKKDVSV